MSKIKIKIGEIEIEGEIFETSPGKKIIEKLEDVRSGEEIEVSGS